METLYKHYHEGGSRRDGDGTRMVGRGRNVDGLRSRESHQEGGKTEMAKVAGNQAGKLKHRRTKLCGNPKVKGTNKLTI